MNRIEPPSSPAFVRKSKMVPNERSGTPWSSTTKTSIPQSTPPLPESARPSAQLGGHPCKVLRHRHVPDAEDRVPRGGDARGVRQVERPAPAAGIGLHPHPVGEEAAHRALAQLPAPVV